MSDRADTIGTIEHTRKLLGFLETLEQPTPQARLLIQQYRAEIAGYEYGRGTEDRVERPEPVGTVELEAGEEGSLLPGQPASDSFHDVAGANV